MSNIKTKLSKEQIVVISTMPYGNVDGTHFNLPNLKGKIPVGLNSAETEFDVLGETGGEKTHILTVGELATHSHNAPAPVGGGSSTRYSAFADAAIAYNGALTGPAGSNTPHNNLQPYITLNYIIKY